MSGYRLYGKRGAGSDAVEIVLKLLDQEVEIIETYGPDRLHGTFLKKNPMGKIPALDLPDGSTMFESAAMILHLCAAHPSPLAPRPGTTAHAHFTQWMVYLSANIYETTLRVYYCDRYGRDEDSVRDLATKELIRHFGIVEDRLGPFLLGETMSAADIYLAMLISWAPDQLGLGDGRFPKLMALWEDMTHRDVIGPILKEGLEAA